MTDLATIAAVAEAVKAELNTAPGGSFSSDVLDGHGGMTRAWTAIRKYLPQYKLEDMAALHVTVVGKAVTSELANREQAAETVQVDIAVQQAVDPDDTAACDSLLLFVQEICDYLRTQSRLTTMPASCWQRADTAPLWDPEMLKTLRVFTAAVTVTYQLIR